ncbi:hypothetical protein [Pengzhenrongella frigida]|uniref:Uncharacterized protein n=1 Tax=Pengzhenrongella frigida TaxID=1259133 RepID=A0A4Q5MZU0_9MICO|nr:hypothetical protein [Cellulomonas sp. HLT2-17]RYV51246.1 hypothetical protein EUA98_09515 [Cellulomonas sp. HLT2-17]
MRRIAAVLALVVAILLTPNGASAAQLTIVGSRTFHAASFSRCDDAVVLLTSASRTSVQVKDLAPACGSANLRLWVWDSNSQKELSGGGIVPALGGTLTITLPGKLSSAGAGLTAFVTVGSWGVPATWEAVLPAVTCTVTGIVHWGNNPRWTRWVTAPAGETCTAALVGTPTTPRPGSPYSDVSVLIATTSTTTGDDSIQWELTMNFADPVFPFVPVGLTSWSNFHVSSTCSALPVVRIGGDLPHHDGVTNGSPRQLNMRAFQSAGGDVLNCA